MRVIKFIMTVLFVWIFSSKALPQKATILDPSPASILTYQEHLDFTVNTSIENFQKSNVYYWVVIASVKSDETYYRSDVEQDRRNVIESFENWTLDLFWPKYAIKGTPYTGHVYDGTQNPFLFLKPMALLVLKVDAVFNQFIVNWFKTSSPQYEGIPASKLKPEMIVAQCEIFFE